MTNGPRHRLLTDVAGDQKTTHISVTHVLGTCGNNSVDKTILNLSNATQLNPGKSTDELCYYGIQKETFRRSSVHTPPMTVNNMEFIREDGRGTANEARTLQNAQSTKKRPIFQFPSFDLNDPKYNHPPLKYMTPRQRKSLAKNAHKPSASTNNKKFYHPPRQYRAPRKQKQTLVTECKSPVTTSDTKCKHPTKMYTAPIQRTVITTTKIQRQVAPPQLTDAWIKRMATDIAEPMVCGYGKMVEKNRNQLYAYEDWFWRQVTVSYEAILRRQRDSQFQSSTADNDQVVAKCKTASQRKEGGTDGSMDVTETGLGGRREEKRNLMEITDADGNSQVFEGSMDEPRKPVDVEDNKGDYWGDGFHGPFCGVSHWLFRIHGRWKLRSESPAFTELEDMAQWQVGEEHLGNMGNQGAELTPPLVQFKEKEGGELTLPAEKLRQRVDKIMVMDTYTWRPPWLGDVGKQKKMGRYVEIERDKRKPPWQMVAVE